MESRTDIEDFLVRVAAELELNRVAGVTISILTPEGWTIGKHWLAPGVSSLELLNDQLSMLGSDQRD